MNPFKDEDKVCDLIERLLEQHQPTILVLPTMPFCYAVRRRFYDRIHNQNKFGNTHFTQSPLAVVRDNPKSRVPTVVRFVSFHDQPHMVQLSKAVIERPLPDPIGYWEQSRRWDKSQASREMYRKEKMQ